MNVLRFAPNVTLRPSSAGAVLLWAFQQWVNESAQDLTVTSGSDGAHSGVGDPHHDGNAFDVRSHDFAIDAKDSFVRKVLNYLGDPQPKDGGYVTAYFFGWLENAGSSDPAKPEHFHFQLRRGMSYPPLTNREAVQDASAGEN